MKSSTNPPAPENPKHKVQKQSKDNAGWLAQIRDTFKPKVKKSKTTGQFRKP